MGGFAPHFSEPRAYEEGKSLRLAQSPDISSPDHKERGSRLRAAILLAWPADRIRLMPSSPD